MYLVQKTFEFIVMFRPFQGSWIEFGTFLLPPGPGFHVRIWMALGELPVCSEDYIKILQRGDRRMLVADLENFHVLANFTSVFSQLLQPLVTLRIC